MGSLFKYKCFEIGSAEPSGKITVFKKYLLLKKFYFWKSSCWDKAPVSQKFMFWLIILEKMLLRNSSYAEKAIIFKM